MPLSKKTNKHTKKHGTSFSCLPVILACRNSFFNGAEIVILSDADRQWENYLTLIMVKKKIKKCGSGSLLILFNCTVATE